MSTSTNFHGVQAAEAKHDGPHSWLKLRDAKGNWIDVFMPAATVEAMAAAFNASHAPAIAAE